MYVIGKFGDLVEVAQRWNVSSNKPAVVSRSLSMKCGLSKTTMSCAETFWSKVVFSQNVPQLEKPEAVPGLQDFELLMATHDRTLPLIHIDKNIEFDTIPRYAAFFRTTSCTQGCDAVVSLYTALFKRHSFLRQPLQDNNEYTSEFQVVGQRLDFPRHSRVQTISM